MGGGGDLEKLEVTIRNNGILLANDLVLNV